MSQLKCKIKASQHRLIRLSFRRKRLTDSMETHSVSRRWTLVLSLTTILLPVFFVYLFNELSSNGGVKSANVYTFGWRTTPADQTPSPEEGDKSHNVTTSLDGQQSKPENDSCLSMCITEEDIESMAVSLPQPLPDYRNPCWMETVPEDFSYYNDSFYYKMYESYPSQRPFTNWRRTFAKAEEMIRSRRHRQQTSTWRLRCYPYFFLVGFTKCGTTDLFQTLRMIPEFFPSLQKEPRFWVNYRLWDTRHGAGVLGKATLSDYLDLFDVAAEQIRQYTIEKDGTEYHPGIVGDLDPRTMWDIYSWKNIKGNEDRDEPKYLSAHHVYHLNPNTKFIALFRNPIERSFSHFKFFNQNDTQLLQSFHSSMNQVLNTLNACIEDNSIRLCVYKLLTFQGRNTTAVKSILGSIYHVFVEDWINVIPRNQFLFIKAEDYFRNRTSIIMEIRSFLGLEEPIAEHVIRQMEHLGVQNPSIKLALPNETRLLLQTFFQPRNERLASVLQDDKWLWNA